MYLQQVRCEGMDWIHVAQDIDMWRAVVSRGEFRPRQTRQLPRAVDLKGRILSCQSY